MIGEPYNGCPVIPWENKPYKNKRVKAKFKNNTTFWHYYNYLTNLVVNLFEYEGLPKSVDPRFLEMGLCQKGMMVYFIDEVAGDVCINTTINGRWNLYNIPINRRAYATNGYQRQLDATNSVIIFNNFTHTPTFPSIQMYAEKLANIARTIDINVYGQRTPHIIGCDEEQLLTMKNLYKDIDDFIPAIYGKKALKDEPLNVYPTLAPYVAGDLQTLLTNTINEFLMYIGVENSGKYKPERQTAEESRQSMGLINASRNILLDARQQAMNQINEMFGRNITVKFRDSVNTIKDYDLLELEES